MALAFSIPPKIVVDCTLASFCNGKDRYFNERKIYNRRCNRIIPKPFHYPLDTPMPKQVYLRDYLHHWFTANSAAPITVTLVEIGISSFQ